MLLFEISRWEPPRCGSPTSRRLYRGRCLAEYGRGIRSAAVPGYYLSLPKILICWLLFLLWVRTTDQLSQDCQRNRLSYVLWNSVLVFFPFVVSFILMWMVPWFGLGLFFMIACAISAHWRRM